MDAPWWLWLFGYVILSGIVACIDVYFSWPRFRQLVGAEMVKRGVRSLGRLEEYGLLVGAVISSAIIWPYKLVRIACRIYQRNG